MSLYHNQFKLEPIIKNTQKNAVFRHPMTDIPTVFKMRVQGAHISKSKFDVKYAVWDKDDLKPGIFELLYVPFLLKNR